MYCHDLAAMVIIFCLQFTVHFFPRIINMKFNEDKQAILEKGLESKFNFGVRHKC